ncbi:MAG TPA: hypothetical protein DIT18_09885 [Pseudomonas sp.]|nr:hypothetical protein [Pseudomonas sp.]
MTPQWKTIAFLSVATPALWIFSEWWEKGLASPMYEAVDSPNGCSRVQTFKPFWLLPDIFHRELAPNDGAKPRWFHSWEIPGFYRLYDNYNGQLIGETVIYDLAFSGGGFDWDQNGGVWVGMTYVGPSIRECTTTRRETPSK